MGHGSIVFSGSGRLDQAALALHEIQALQLPSQSPYAVQAVCATRAVESGELLRAVGKAHNVMSKNTCGNPPHGGVHIVRIAERTTRAALFAGGARSVKDARR